MTTGALGTVESGLGQLGLGAPRTVFPTLGPPTSQLGVASSRPGNLVPGLPANPSLLLAADLILTLTGQPATQQTQDLAADLVVITALPFDLDLNRIELAADLILGFDPAATLAQTQYLAATLGLGADLDATVRRTLALAGDLLVVLALPSTARQTQNLAADLLIEPRLRDGYVGRGTGLIVGDQVVTFDTLRLGDSFTAIVPHAGPEGKAGQVRVVELHYDQSGRVESIDVEFHPFTDGATVLGVSAAGRLRYTLQRRGDLVRTVVSQGQTVATLSRARDA